MLLPSAEKDARIWVFLLEWPLYLHCKRKPATYDGHFTLTFQMADFTSLHLRAQWSHGGIWLYMGQHHTVIQAYSGVIGGDEQLVGVSRQELHAGDLLPCLLPTPLVLHIYSSTTTTELLNSSARASPKCECDAGQ